MSRLRSAATLPIDASKRWIEALAPTHAAALAFYALTSLAPLLVISIAVAGTLFGDDAVRGVLVEQIEGRIGHEAAVVLEERLRSLALGGRNLTASLLAALTIALASTGLFIQLRDGLNALREPAPARTAVFWTLLRNRLLAFALVLGVGVVLLLSLLAKTVLVIAAESVAVRLHLHPGVLVAAETVMTLASLTVVLAFLYRYLPGRRMHWPSAWFGGSAAALLFLPGGWIIGTYLGRAGISSAYGAAGSLVVLLFWIYYASLLLLWGGALAVEHAMRYGADAAVSPADPVRDPARKPTGDSGAVPRKPNPGSRVGLFVLLGVLSACLPSRGVAQDGRVRVGVTGVDGDARRNVMAVLSLARLDGQTLLESRIRLLHRRAEIEIQSALEPFGYYRSDVSSSLRFENGRWAADYEVDTGPALLLRHVQLRVLGDGSEDQVYLEAAAAFALGPGDVLMHAPYELGKAVLIDAAARRGYLDAAFDTAEIRIDLDAYTADIVLVYRTGPRYLFGPVTFVQDVLDQDLLRGLVPFRTGEPFDANRLLELQVALSQGPWFSGVEVVPRRDQARGLEVPIVVELRPRKPERYLIGGGYGTDTGPRATFEFELRRVGRQGHRSEGRVRASAIEREIATQYFIPLRFPRTEVITFTAGYAKLNPRTSRSEKVVLGTAVARARGRWRENFSLIYQRETFQTGTDRGTSNQLLAGVTWSRTKTDDRVFPREGYRVRFGTQASHDAILSDISLVRLDVHVTRIVSPAARTRLLLRADAGIAHSPVFRDVPATLRFYAGGDQSLRGFGYRTLGPLDENGSVVGGDRLLTGGLEIEQRLLERWGLAAFVDGGNAFSTGDEPVEAGAGVGVRWLSPIGLVRLDGAWAVSRSNAPFRLHIRIGPDL